MMKLTAKASVVLSAIFAAICFSVAPGFSSLGDIADPVQKKRKAPADA
jgi:hypothetical protein